MQQSTTATIRTTVNGTILTAVVSLAYKLFGWEVKVDDLLPFLPLLAPCIAVFYRLSLYLSERFPAIGYILFGVNKSPSYHLTNK